MSVAGDPIRRRIAAGGVALGLIVRTVRSGEIAAIARASDHDFLFIDTQHAIFGREAVAEIITAARGAGLAPLVRIRGSEDPDASLFLDAGAAGLIVPDVSTAEQARRIASRCRFAPRGRRSLPGPLAHNASQPLSTREAMELVDSKTLLVCMIETLEGLADVEAIAAVDGVDVLHVGAVDLLLALGRPDAQGCPEILEAIARVAEAARRHGKVLGIGGDRDPQRRQDYVRQGARFMTTDIDTALLLKGATSAVAVMRETLRP